MSRPAESLVLDLALDNLELGLTTQHGPWADCEMGGLSRDLEEMRRAHKVVLTRSALACVDEMPANSRQETCTDMIRSGVFNLPFPSTVVQADMLNEDKTSKVLILHVRQVGHEELAGEVVFVCRAIMEWMDKPGKFYMLPVEFWIRIPDKQSTNFECYTRTRDWYKNDARATRVHEFIKANPAYMESCVVVTTALVVLSQTRGVVQRPVQPDKSRARLARLRRRTPEFSHTVLELHRDVRGLSGKTYVTPEGRTRPRLHWRRGHSRQQPCGPRGAERRTVWVQAHLVGHGEDGHVTHDYSLKP